MARAQDEFIIRLATAADAPTVAWHRARMWQDMGDLPNELFESLRSRAEVYQREAIERGDYVGWLAASRSAPEIIVAGAGVHLRSAMPFPVKGTGGAVRVADGRIGTVVNVFTEPEWRRRGLAALLMEEVIAWSRAERLDRLTLHASNAGRALYEQMGFVATNEMRLAADLPNE